MREKIEELRKLQKQLLATTQNTHSLAQNIQDAIAIMKAAEKEMCRTDMQRELRDFYQSKHAQKPKEEIKKEPEEILHPKCNKYYKTDDGWFKYFVNIETGEKKLHLENGDIEVDRKLDDFYREDACR